MPKKKKKPRGKAKGSQFERDVCKDIYTAFASFGATPEDVRRSILSGGHEHSFGDIGLSEALRKIFPFAIECKWYKKIELYWLQEPWKKMGKSCWFRVWWKQTLEGAHRGGRVPILIFKSNNHPVLCATPVHRMDESVWHIVRAMQHSIVYDQGRSKGGEGKIWVGKWHKFLEACVEVAATRKREQRGKSRATR